MGHQGSVLHPLLFITYINYLDSGISSNISKFADDTKIGRQISLDREAVVLQDKLNRMHEWTVKWQTDFDINRCSTLEIDTYILDGVDIGKSNLEKDLGVLVSQYLRPREQRISDRNRANRVLDFITRSVSNRSADVLLRLYLTLIRPHL